MQTNFHLSLKQLKQLINAYQFRASSCGKLMVEPQGGSNLEKLEVKKQELSSYSTNQASKISESELKIQGINKGTKSYEKEAERKNKLVSELKEKVSKFEKEISELEHKKHEINISETTKSFLIEVYTEILTGRVSEIKNKYVEKGLSTEASSIEELNEFFDKFLIKNEERKFSEHLQGECDIDNEDDDEVLDVKNAWSIQTFQKYTKNKPKLEDGTDDFNRVYWWQGQVYMYLWKRGKFRLVRILSSLPEGLIKDEFNRFLYEIGSDKKDTKLYKDGCEAIRFNMAYDDIPLKYRVIQFTSIYSQEAIDRLHARIIDCKKWLCEYAESEWNRVNGIEYIEFEEVAEPEITVVYEEKKDDIEESDDTISIKSNEESEEIQEPAVIKEHESSSPEEKLKKRINECKDVQECIKLHKEIAPLYELYPSIKTILLDKKASFNVIPIVQEKKSKKEPELNNPFTPIKTGFFAGNPVPETDEEKKKTLNEVWEKIKLCKTDYEVKEVYVKERNLLDLKENGKYIYDEFRQVISNVGKKLEVKQFISITETEERLKFIKSSNLEKFSLNTGDFLIDLDKIYEDKLNLIKGNK